MEGVVSSVHFYYKNPAVFTDVYYSKMEAEPFFKLVETKFQKHNTSNNKISVQLFNTEVKFLTHVTRHAIVWYTRSSKLWINGLPTGI